jgi:hypothetical protein
MIIMALGAIEQLFREHGVWNITSFCRNGRQNIEKHTAVEIHRPQ